MELRDQIRRCREAAGLTRSEFARRAGLHQTHPGAIEEGLWDPSLATLRKIAPVLREAGQPLPREIEEALGTGESEADPIAKDA